MRLPCPDVRRVQIGYMVQCSGQRNFKTGRMRKYLRDLGHRVALSGKIRGNWQAITGEASQAFGFRKTW